MTLEKTKPNPIPEGYQQYDMTVKIIAEKIDERVKLKSYKTSCRGQKNPISGKEFDVIYGAHADFLKLCIYFGRNGVMDNLQKPIQIKFKTEWRIDLNQCSGKDCPIIDPRNSDDATVKTTCVFDDIEKKETSKY